MDPRGRILEHAGEVGFDLAGIAPLAPPQDAGRFAAWLDAGHHAGLDYLARNRERILDPRALRRDGKSLLVVGLAHSRPAFELPGGGRVARYAAGRDYHNVVGKLLRRLARRLEQDGLLAAGSKSRAIVDAGPLLERSHAAAAGIGFPSKAANLLHPRFGPWFFLGELILPLELEPTPPAQPVASGSCGTCRACIDACPTEAIREPGLVDAGRCISYHTIESKSSMPRAVRERIGGWAFGCDVCSEVCPWGREAPDLSSRFGTHPALESGLIGWLREREERPAARLGSPIQRPGRAGLARNAAIALGWTDPGEAPRQALLEALSFDPAALVRESAAWSLARAYRHDQGVRRALEAACRQEPDEASRRDMRASLESLG